MGRKKVQRVKILVFFLYTPIIWLQKTLIHPLESYGLLSQSLFVAFQAALTHLPILGEHPFELKENISSALRSFLLYTYMHNYTMSCGMAASNAPPGAETKTLEPH